MRPLRLLLPLLIVSIAACSSPQTRPTQKSPVRTAPPPKPPSKAASQLPFDLQRDAPPLQGEIPPDIHKIPDAVPQLEPRSRYGNPKTYEVLGKTYRVMDSAHGFRERGYASWYGKKFHGRRTSSGEPYDMFAMTAAHKSLPLPSYVRVTNTRNGASTVVKVNDRGPFHPGRIIDLSYAAATKLGIIDDGHAPVEIEVLNPEAPQPSTPAPEPAPSQGWLQVAAYFDPINAVALREDLARAGLPAAEILVGDENGTAIHRVVIGPFGDRQASQATRGQLQAQGFDAGWLGP